MSAPRSTCSKVGTAQEPGYDDHDDEKEENHDTDGEEEDDDDDDDDDDMITLVNPFLMRAGCSGCRDIRASWGDAW